MSNQASMKQKKKRAHNPTDTICGYPYCVKCGTIYLKNEATRKEIEKSCPGDEK